MLTGKTMYAIKKAVSELLDVHQGEIDEAYIKAEKGIVVSLGVKILPIAPGTHYITTRFSMISGRVKDEINAKVDEDQAPLLKAVERLRPKKGSGIDSITISNLATGESATLKAREK